jgi:hypothetical protein
VPIHERLTPEAARALGWVPCRSVRVVEHCGHATEVLPTPTWGLVPVWEEP